MKKSIFVIALLCVIAASSYGEIILFRPHSSIGYLSSDEVSGFAVTYGLKALLSTNDYQRYGVIVNHLFLPGNKNVSYLCTGLMIEQVIFDYFNMGIGTIGFINLVHSGDNPFGIYSHLGFEYKFTKYINIVAAYQSNLVFGKSLIQHNAFYVGLGIQL